MVKRTLFLSGHQTSVALEPEFWSAVEWIARTRECSWSDVIAEIDADREGNNLASAIRVAVLKTFHPQDKR